MIFLSYAREDREAVEQIYNDLVKAGRQPWMDVRNIVPGQNWEHEIQKQIIGSDVAIIFLSQRSVSKTGYVQAEQAKFLEQLNLRPEDSIYLIPAFLDDCVLPQRLNRLHAVNLRAPNGWDDIIRSLDIAEKQKLARLGSSEQHGPFIVFSRTIEEKWQGLPGYEANLTYPELLSDSENKICDQLNSIFLSQCLSRLHRVRGNRWRQEPQFWENMPGVARNDEYLSFKITTLSLNILSIVFQHYAYWPGAAHGNTWFSAMNYTLDPISELILSDFFENNNFQTVIETKLRDGILRSAWDRGIKNLDSKWVEEGTAIITEKPIPFTFSNLGLTFHFAPYTVAYYAAGTWEVTVPFYDVRHLLKPDGFHRKLAAE